MYRNFPENWRLWRGLILYTGPPYVSVHVVSLHFTNKHCSQVTNFGNKLKTALRFTPSCIITIRLEPQAGPTAVLPVIYDLKVCIHQLKNSIIFKNFDIIFDPVSWCYIAKYEEICNLMHVCLYWHLHSHTHTHTHTHKGAAFITLLYGSSSVWWFLQAGAALCSRQSVHWHGDIMIKHTAVRTTIKFHGVFEIQGGARNVIPLIVHVTHFYYY